MPYNKPFDYYVLLDKDSSVLETSKKSDLKKSKGQKIEKRSYSDAPQYMENPKVKKTMTHLTPKMLPLLNHIIQSANNLNP